MIRKVWYKCPKCGNPKMLLVRSDTQLVNFPGYCKKCKRETIITINLKEFELAPKSQVVNSK